MGIFIGSLMIHIKSASYNQVKKPHNKAILPPLAIWSASYSQVKLNRLEFPGGSFNYYCK